MAVRYVRRDDFIVEHVLEIKTGSIGERSRTVPWIDAKKRLWGWECHLTKQWKLGNRKKQNEYKTIITVAAP